ncbi:hypothetical protein [Caballeronia mineralivorans]|jgi:hypothetical protein|nr:hypothetical protein [Caballeronia mineralivorans]MEA3097077.1 hypothetical protein [Caballeronia mineralivorans]
MTSPSAALIHYLGQSHAIEPKADQRRRVRAGVDPWRFLLLGAV